MVRPRDDFFDCLPRTRNSCFHTSILAIAHPARDAEFARFMVHGVAKSDALHLANDFQVFDHQVAAASVSGSATNARYTSPMIAIFV